MSIQWVPVSDLNVRCSYPIRKDAIAASDTCQAPAMSAVKIGSYYYRCKQHAGLIRGNVVEKIHLLVPKEMPMTNTDYRHLVEDVQAAVNYVNEITVGETPLLNIEDRLFRASLRLMRAEKGLAALSAVIVDLSQKHQIEGYR